MSNKITPCLHPELRHCQNLAVPVVPPAASTSVTYRLPDQYVMHFQTFPSFDSAIDFLRVMVMSGHLVTVFHA